jgi:dihydrofolate reductase
VNKDFDGDVFFPEIDFTEWEIVSLEDFPVDDQLGFSYSYVIYDRKKK